MEKKKKNIFIRFFCAVGRAINYFFCFIIFAIAWVFAKIFFRCKVKGKENISKTDEAQIFISNHYELFGPIAMFLRFFELSRQKGLFLPIFDAVFHE